ncbi:MAG: response regulator transcription factor [Lewinella sp.]|nr:response regulator transcription factor [Lewinella sp.]
MEASLLLIEDDSSIGYLLSEYLKMKGYAVEWARNGQEGLKALEKGAFDLAIVDVMMPGMDGFTFAERLKAAGQQLPFIFLTARSMKIDVLKGFALGAVDYLKKPIDEEELLVRIENHLSRLRPVEESSSPESIPIGRYTFDPQNLSLSLQGEVNTLTARERDLLLFLVGRKNQLCSHKEILTKLWGKNDYFSRKSLNVFITKLRGHLSEDPAVKIENVHGQGFILRA